MSIGGKLLEGNGIASAIELVPSSIYPGALCLRRRLLGLAYRAPQPGCLPPFDRWQATGSDHQYELNLQIPVDEWENVTIVTLEEYAAGLRKRSDWRDGEPELKRFDYAVRRLLVTVLRIFDPQYSFGLAGLITPQNVLLVSWPGWAGRPGTEFATEIVLADVGIHDLTMSTTPHWLEEDCKYAFLWDCTPEEMLRRNRYDAPLYIRAMARLIACVLAPETIRGQRAGTIPADELKLLRAEVWSKLAVALNPAGEYAKLPALDGWKKFTTDVYKSGPSRHLVFGKGLPAPIQPTDKEEPPPNPPGWVSALLLVLLLAGVAGVGAYAYLNQLPDPKCECCDFVSHKSRLFSRLKRFDEARRGGGPTVAPELKSSNAAGGAPIAAAPASFAVASSANPVKYQRGPMFDGQFELIRDLHHAAEDDGFQFDETERDCLRKLRTEYYEDLRLENLNLRSVFGERLLKKDVRAALVDLHRELSELKSLAIAIGDVDRPGSWEKGLGTLMEQFGVPPAKKSAAIPKSASSATGPTIDSH